MRYGLTKGKGQGIFLIVIVKYIGIING